VQGLKVSVAEILGQPGHYRDISVDAELPQVGNALVSVADLPLQGQLRAEAVVEGILITGPITTAFEARCARCLQEVHEGLSLEVCELFVAEGHETPDGEEVYEVDGFDVDLEPMLRDTVTLALPLNPLCREDCKGLCARCGKDLNDGPCGCVEEEIDPRWAALSELRDKLG
jgi:uncharacterized protein